MPFLGWKRPWTRKDRNNVASEIYESAPWLLDVAPEELRRIIDALYLDNRLLPQMRVVTSGVGANDTTVLLMME